MHKHITYYTRSTVCQSGFYVRISSNEFLSSSPWAYTGFAKGGQLIEGLGELYAAKRLAKRGVVKSLLEGSEACFPDNLFLNGAIWCVLEQFWGSRTITTTRNAEATLNNNKYIIIWKWLLSYSSEFLKPT